VVVTVLAVASMTFGNLAAYWQDDPRRLLGWSTVSQVGYLLVPVAVAGHSDLALPSLLLYLAGYALTNIAAFAVSAAYPDRRALTDFAGIGRAQPRLAGGLLVSLLGLVGTPPTIVFVGKVAISVAAWDAGQPWLAIVVMINSMASLFYYLRWLAPTFGVDRPQSDGTADRSGPRPAGRRITILTGAATLLLGVASVGLFALA
jgi:NADH-quinone oxidoreductase subunit N